MEVGVAGVKQGDIARLQERAPSEERTRNWRRSCGHESLALEECCSAVKLAAYTLRRLCQGLLRS